MVKKLNRFKTALFGSASALSALSYFASKPSQEAYARQVERETGLSHGSALSAIRALEKSRMISCTPRGRQVFCRFQSKNPSARAFKVLLNVSNLEKLVAELSPVSKKIILFGSAATGTNSEESDIDLLIVSSDRVAVESALSRAKGLRVSPVIKSPQDIVRLRKTDPVFYENAVAKGMTLYEEGD